MVQEMEIQLPVVDISRYLEISEKLSSDPVKLCEQVEELTWLKELCDEVSRNLRETGVLVVKDPRCTARDNDRFMDMMEKYFETPQEFKQDQLRPNAHYQVGVTPGGIEIPKSLGDERIHERIRGMAEENQPTIPKGPDLKWRYMWRIGSLPSNTRFQELNSEAVIPEGFPEWKETMDTLGHKMVSAIQTVAELAAIGFGLPKNAFTTLMNQGPLLLAPTGGDLRHHGEEGTVFAGYHYDINFLTIHGRSRFPGLNIWLRNGRKVEVKVPHGCFLVQTGKQMEWLTAGECIAGMHEVVVTKSTTEAIKSASDQNRSLWRVSSTLFGHLATDTVLKPLGHFAESQLAANYPPVCAGEFVKQELAIINLK